MLDTESGLYTLIYTFVDTQKYMNMNVELGYMRYVITGSLESRDKFNRDIYIRDLVEYEVAGVRQVSEVREGTRDGIIVFYPFCDGVLPCEVVVVGNVFVGIY